MALQRPGIMRARNAATVEGAADYLKHTTAH